MSFNPSQTSGAYTSNTGITPVSSHIFQMNGAPSSSTINGPNGPFKLGDQIINVTSGTLYYLSAQSTSNNITSNTWSVLAADSGGVLPVSEGGTGDSTLTAHGVLIGEGTSPVNVTTAGTLGQPLVSGGASADPAFALLGVVGGGTGVATLTGLPLFSGTSAVTAVTYTANTSWAPALAVGGSSTGITYTSHVGQYTQIGGLVSATFSIQLSSKGSNSGAITITNLPVAGTTNTQLGYQAIGFSGPTLTSNYTAIIALAPMSTTTILTFNIIGSGESATALTAAMLSGTDILSGTISYLV